MAPDFRPNINLPDYSGLVNSYKPPSETLLSPIAQGAMDFAQKRIAYKKQQEQQKQWADAIDQLVQQNPMLAPYGGAMKMDQGSFDKIAPVVLKQKQMQQAEAVPFDQAVQIASTAGNQTAAAPFIQTAQAQGRDFLTKQEMSDMFKTITTSASQGRGEYFKGMLDVNRGRLGLSQRQAAFGGQFGKNQLSLNTAIGHVKTSFDAFASLGNTNEAFMNVPINKLKTMTNDPKIIQIGVSLNALQGELANVFKGSGATDQEIGQWQKYLNENLTPSQYREALPQIAELLDSRSGALSYQQQQVAPGIVDPSNTLTPKAKGVMQGIRQNKNILGGPTIGEVRKGYRFKGGDPGSQASWEKMQ